MSLSYRFLVSTVLIAIGAAIAIGLALAHTNEPQVLTTASKAVDIPIPSSFSESPTEEPAREVAAPATPDESSETSALEPSSVLESYQQLASQQIADLQEQLREVQRSAGEERSRTIALLQRASFEQSEEFDDERPAQSTAPLRITDERDEDHDDELRDAARKSALQQSVAVPAGSPRGTSLLDIDPDEGDGRLTIQCRDSDIRAVLDSLAKQGGFSVVTSRTINAAQPPILVNMSLNNVDAREALKVVLRTAGLISRKEGQFVYVGTKEDFRDIDQSQQKLRTRVYYPNYVKASELQTLLTPMISKQVGRISVTTPSQAGIALSSDQAGGDSIAQGEVLMVFDYESVLEEIDQIVADIDKRPRQVAIEAMILSVRLNDTNKRGVDFQLLRDQAHLRLTSGSPLSDLGQFSTKDGGLKIGFLDSSLALFMDALETIGDTNVIASPRLTCLNRQRAEILIGSKLGYVSTTVTETSSTQAVQFLDVGTQLRFRPFISSDGSIRLEIHPEVSTGNVRVVNGLTLPDKEVTEVTTNILCYDGSTVIIGGLIREELATAANQIPFLGNLKWAGWLFRRETETRDRRELIVLISPRIVNDEAMNAEAVREGGDFLSRQDYYRDKMSPIGKRFYGERFLRLANSAWSAGDAQTAFRYVNLALQFDPQNLNVTTLRNQIVEAYPEFDQPIYRRLNEGASIGTRLRRDYSRAGFPWAPPERDGLPDSPFNFYDRGEPGEVREFESIDP